MYRLIRDFAACTQSMDDVDEDSDKTLILRPILESLSQFQNRILPRVYKRSITHSTMYKKVPFS